MHRQPTIKLHYKPMWKTITIYDNNEHTYHLIATRYDAANKYIQKFWKQTIAGDASICYVIIILFILAWLIFGSLHGC